MYYDVVTARGVEYTPPIHTRTHTRERERERKKVSLWGGQENVFCPCACVSKVF